MQNVQLLLLLGTLIGCSVGQYGHGGYHGGFHGGYGGDDYGYGGHGGHGGHGHGHGYASPVIKALPVIPKVAVAKTVDYYSEPNYSYSYGVSDAYTGDKKSAHETRDGHVTKGQYQVLQPDGILRTVNYVADPIHGFQATVHNSAPAVHAVAKAAIPVVAKVADYGHHHGGHGHDGHHGGYEHGGYGAIATPVVKAIAPAYGGHHHGGYDGGHIGGGHYGGGAHYAAAPYHSQIQRVSHASGVTHYGGALAAAVPAYGYGGHHQANYDY